MSLKKKVSIAFGCGVFFIGIFFAMVIYILGLFEQPNTDKEISGVLGANFKEKVKNFHCCVYTPNHSYQLHYYFMKFQYKNPEDYHLLMKFLNANYKKELIISTLEAENLPEEKLEWWNPPDNTKDLYAFSNPKGYLKIQHYDGYVFIVYTKFLIE